MANILRGARAVWRKLLCGDDLPSPDSLFVPQAETYHRAEENRYRVLRATTQPPDKPFDDLRSAPLHLYRLGLVLDALDLGVRDEVLDFGAGDVLGIEAAESNGPEDRLARYLAVSR